LGKSQIGFFIILLKNNMKKRNLNFFNLFAKLAVFIVLIFTNLNCQKSTGNIAIEDTYDLVGSGSVKQFNLPERAINRSVCLIPYSDNGANLLYYLSEYTNRLLILNLDKNEVDTMITFQQEGPNGFGSVNGFEIINKDTLLITSFFQQAILISNSKAERIGVINYRKYNNLTFLNPGVSQTVGNMRMHFQDNHIIIPFYPGVNKQMEQDKRPKDLRFIAVIDTTNKYISTWNIGFPKNYWENQIFPAFFSFFNSENQFYVSFEHYDSIYTSKNGENWVGHNAKSSFVDLEEVVEPNLGKMAAYLRLVPDPYRKLFYRFVRHKQTELNRSDVELTRYPQKFSIIILDSNLNYLGETVFPEDTYDPHGYFITKEGLYLSRSHIYNPSYNENTLEFELFNVKKHETL